MHTHRLWIPTVIFTAWPMICAAQAGATATPAAQPASAADTAGFAGFVDFGARASSIDGDGARYERYRDLGDGLFIEALRWQRETSGWFVDLNVNHVGRRDQRYTIDLNRPGRIKAWAQYDQIPMLLSRTTRTLYGNNTLGLLTIPDALQAQVQATPASLAQVFADNARTFETRSTRRIGAAGGELLLTPELTVKATFRHTERSGSIPYGGSFGHSSLVELPAPVQHSLSDVDASAEWQRNAWLVRAGYTGSWFSNDFQTLTFDNPFRATDSASTPSRGRLSLPPSNSFLGVNGLASVKLPRRTRVTASMSIGSLRDAGTPIMPQTINATVVTTPLDRSTVNGEARTTSFNLNLVSRPTPELDITARYRTYEYDNRTPEFAMTQRVSYDNAVSAVSPAVHTEPFGVDRGTFDADVRYTPKGRLTAGVGYSRIGEDRTHRIFESTTDNVARVTADLIGLRWLTVRAKYEHAQRRGTGIEAGEAELASIGEQPGMRHFDIASRNRNRVTILSSVVPGGIFAFTGSIAAGKDDYIESEFGLRDNSHRVYSLGVDAAVSDRVQLGGSYAFEKYTALSRSRQANPGVQFTDPSRNWATDAADNAHSVRLNADLLQVLPKLDVHVNYDFSRARSRYRYIAGAVPDRTLPEEVVVDTTLPPPSQLPPTLSELHMATTDVLYQLNSRVGIGVSVWFERYRVEDFTLDVDANPELTRGQALLMGYLYRPYTATTGWLRVFYRF